jgi:predicted dehydrogenase
MSLTRRSFLHRSGQVVAAATLLPKLAAARTTPQPVSPHNRVVVGLIGGRNMGWGVLYHHLQLPGVVCGGICDVDANVREKCAADVAEITGTRPKLYTDFRQLLEDPEIDAVIIGTPDHWHCLQTVMACEAGKDVYVEKPAANSIAECEVMVKAARRYGRVVQVGQQQRSGPGWQEVVRLIRGGRIGRVRQVKMWANFHYAIGAPRVPDEPPPPGVEWELWQGPAAIRPFNPSRFHGYWRFQWAYGGGLMSDWGVHLIDIPLWALQVDGPPKSITSIGGIFAPGERAIETPDTQAVSYEFDDFTMTWEHAGGLQTGPYNRNYGIAFVGNDATLVVNRNGWEIIPERRDGGVVTPAVPLQETADSDHAAHVANFVQCVRERTEPACPIEAGRLAAFYAHAGNIAWRTGSRLTWDREQQRFHQNEAANALLRPEYRRPWTFPSS